MVDENKDLVNVKIELAKSWFVLSQALLTIAGFLFLIYTLVINIGFSLVKIPLDLYISNSSLMQEFNQAKPAFDEVMKTITNIQGLMVSLIFLLIIFSILTWGIGREELSKILIKDNPKKPMKKLDNKFFLIMSIIVAILGIILGVIKKDWILAITGVLFIPIAIIIWKKIKKEK